MVEKSFLIFGNVMRRFIFQAVWKGFIRIIFVEGIYF